MLRSSKVLIATVLSLTLSAACDNASNDNKKANSAQAEADDKTAAATKEADEKVQSAQAAADDKIASARADFMKLREDYRHTTTTNLVDLDHKVTDLETRASEANGKKKVGLDANLKQIHARRETFGEDYRALENASASTWDDTKLRLDKEWTDLKALVDKV
jgi:regulator of protease activity HflC (stomatin/prohibitin superfamily)